MLAFSKFCPNFAQSRTPTTERNVSLPINWPVISCWFYQSDALFTSSKTGTKWFLVEIISQFLFMSCKSFTDSRIFNFNWFFFKSVLLTLWGDFKIRSPSELVPGDNGTTRTTSDGANQQDYFLRLILNERENLKLTPTFHQKVSLSWHSPALRSSAPCLRPAHFFVPWQAASKRLMGVGACH